MSVGKLGVVWLSLVVTCALYATAAQAQALFPNIYPKNYAVSCSGVVCGTATACTSSSPPSAYVNFGSTGQMEFNSPTAGVGTAEYNIANGASVVSFGVASLSFKAINGTGSASPPPICTSATSAACIPTGCALVTDTLPALKEVSTEMLCFSHNGAEFSAVGTKLFQGTYTCHGQALTY
jgi:hypothetical protein